MGAGRLRIDASTFDRDDDPPRPGDILREGDVTCRFGRLVIVRRATESSNASDVSGKGDLGLGSRGKQ